MPLPAASFNLSLCLLSLHGRGDKNMNTLWTLALASLVAVSSTALAKEPEQPKDCGPPQQLASVDLTIAGAVLVPVTLEGKSAWMVLDTANGWSMLNMQAATDFGLTLSDMPYGAIVNVGNDHVRNVAVINSFAIGNFEYRKSKMMVTPQATALHVVAGRPVVGHMGQDFFAAVDFELDFAKHKLNLFSQDHCPGKVVYWADSFQSVPLLRSITGEYFFPMELDGKKVEAALAISSPETSLTTDVTEKLYGFDENSAGVEAQPAAAGASAAHYRAMKLTASGLHAEDVKVTLRAPNKHCKMQVGMVRKSRAAGYGADCLGVFPLLLGRNVLEGLHLYFATRENVLYFTPASAAK